MSGLLEDDEAKGKLTGVDTCEGCNRREKDCVCNEPDPDVKYDY